MNDFFSVLDDFEIQEFVAADESDYAGSSFSIDSYDDTSQVDPEKTEFTDTALDDVLSDKTEVTTTDNSEYVWRSGTNPFSGTTAGVYAGYSNYVQKNDGGADGKLQYREVTLSMTSGLSFTRTIAETAPLKVDSTDVAVAGTAGLNLTLSNGNVTGGSFSMGNGSVTLWDDYSVNNADTYNSDDEKTRIDISGFADEDVAFTADNNNLKAITATGTDGGTITVNGDYDFTLNGESVRIKNVDTANSGDIVFNYNADGEVEMDISALTALDDTVLEVVAAGGATTLIPPVAATTADGQIKIGGVAYDYASGGSSYFMLDGTDVEGYVLVNEGDAIKVNNKNDIAVYDDDDTSDGSEVIKVDGSNYTVTKLRNGYSATITNSADVTIGDTTLDFTISKTTKDSTAFVNAGGLTVYFDEDGTVKGVKGLNLFTNSGDAMAVTAPNVAESDDGIALINSGTTITNGNVTSASIAGYVAVSDGDFTYTGSNDNVPTINVATGTQVFSVSNAIGGTGTSAGTANITVGTGGGSVTDGQGETFQYSGSGSLYAVKDDIRRFNMTAAGDAVQMSASDPIAVNYNGSAITIPEVVEPVDGKFAVSMASNGNFIISDLGAGSKVDDRFTFENAGGTVEFEADGDVVAITGYTGELTLYQTDTGLTINGDTLTYALGTGTTSITATVDTTSGVTKVTGLHSGDNINSTDEATVFQFVTTGLTDVFTVGNGTTANTYTVTGDTDGVITITAGGVVDGLDEDATLTVDPAKALKVNGADFAAEDVDGESVVGFEKKNGEIGAYVTDGTHPLFNGYTSVTDIKNWIGVAPATTYRESTDGSLDLTSTDGTAQYTFDTSGVGAVAFNDDGKNLAIVDDDATGDKTITLGNKGDAVIMMGRDEYGSVNIIGGSGNDTIFVGGREGVEDAVVHGAGMTTSIDLSKGGVDKVHTYAAANANIILNNYDETSLAGVVLHDPEIPYIKDLTDAIKEDLIVVDGNQIIAIDRDETRTGVDRKTRITVNNTNTAHQSMVRLFGYKDNKDTYGDDYGQLVGFTGVLGGTLDASDIAESLVLIGNKDGNHSVGSFLKTGTADDTVFAGAMDTIDTGDGVDLIILDDTVGRDAATVIVGRGAGDAVQNLQSGFTGDVFDVTSFDGKLAYTFENGTLGILDESSKSTLLATTDETGQFIKQRFINGSDTLYAAIAQEGGAITVTDADATVPNYFLANDGAIDFTGFSGDVGLDVDGEDLDYPSAINGTSVSIGSAVNSLIGGSGTTIFKGGKGDEVLVAGTGESSLYGGGGQNLLVGSTGNANKTGSTEFFVIGIHNGAQNSITGFEFIANGGNNQATFDNLNLGLADGNQVTDLVANADGSVSLGVKGDESGALEKAVIAGAAGQEMLVDRGTDTESVVQIASSVVTVNHDYVDFYAATDTNATVQIGDVTSAKVWLEAPDFSDGVEYVGDFTVIDARTSAAQVEMAGNNVANTIYGGLGNASMWGGAGNANDVMVGGSAHNEYYYEVGNGNDTILSARDGDIIHLGMSLDQVNFDGTEMSGSGIIVRFNDGGAGSLYIDGSADVSFSFDDNTTVRANRQTGQFE